MENRLHPELRKTRSKFQRCGLPSPIAFSSLRTYRKNEKWLAIHSNRRVLYEKKTLSKLTKTWKALQKRALLSSIAFCRWQTSGKNRKEQNLAFTEKSQLYSLRREVKTYLPCEGRRAQKWIRHKSLGIPLLLFFSVFPSSHGTRVVNEKQKKRKSNMVSKAINTFSNRPHHGINLFYRYFATEKRAKMPYSCSVPVSTVSAAHLLCIACYTAKDRCVLVLSARSPARILGPGQWNTLFLATLSDIAYGALVAHYRTELAVLPTMEQWLLSLVRDVQRDRHGKQSCTENERKESH